MPIKITRADVLAGFTAAQRDTMFPQWANDADPQVRIAPADEQCHARIQIHYNTDFAVVATDGNEIKELIKAADGLLGAVGAPTPATVINGLRATSDTIADVLGLATSAGKQEFTLNPIPCGGNNGGQGQRFKVAFEVVGSWLVNDPDARFDDEEVARLSLLLMAASSPASDAWEHAKRTLRRVSFPIPGKGGNSQRFRVEVETPPVTQPFIVYARAMQEVQTNGPGNSPFNVVDLLQDAFTTSVSAIAIDSIFITIEDLVDKG